MIKCKKQRIKSLCGNIIDQEYGTYKMAAHPFLKPGIMDNMDEYEEIAKEAIESCLP